jgi:hypothetical protein
MVDETDTEEGLRALRGRGKELVAIMLKMNIKAGFDNADHKTH